MKTHSPYKTAEKISYLGVLAKVSVGVRGLAEAAVLL